MTLTEDHVKLKSQHQWIHYISCPVMLNYFSDAHVQGVFQAIFTLKIFSIHSLQEC